MGLQETRQASPAALFKLPKRIKGKKIQKRKAGVTGMTNGKVILMVIFK